MVDSLHDADGVYTVGVSINSLDYEDQRQGRIELEMAVAQGGIDQVRVPAT